MDGVENGGERPPSRGDRARLSGGLRARGGGESGPGDLGSRLVRAGLTLPGREKWLLYAVRYWASSPAGQRSPWGRGAAQKTTTASPRQTGMGQRGPRPAHWAQPARRIGLRGQAGDGAPARTRAGLRSRLEPQVKPSLEDSRVAETPEGGKRVRAGRRAPTPEGSQRAEGSRAAAGARAREASQGPEARPAREGAPAQEASLPPEGEPALGANRAAAGSR